MSKNYTFNDLVQVAQATKRAKDYTLGSSYSEVSRLEHGLRVAVCNEISNILAENGIHTQDFQTISVIADTIVEGKNQ